MQNIPINPSITFIESNSFIIADKKEFGNMSEIS